MQYEALDIQIVELDTEDVIQTSETGAGGSWNGNDNETPGLPLDAGY